MNILKKLFIIQLKYLLSFNASAGKRKRQSRSVWLMLGFIAALGLYIGGVYAFQMAQTFQLLGGDLGLMFVILSGMAVLIGLLLIVMGVNGIIFQAKDSTFLLSLPIDPKKIMLAKLLAVYGEALLVTFFMLVPSIVAYVSYQPLPVIAYPLFLVIILLLPMIATVLALIFGYFFSLIQSRTKASPMVMNLIMLVGFGAVMYFTMRMQTAMTGEAFSPVALPPAILLLAKPFYWVRDILVDTNLLALIKLALLSIIPFGLLVWLLSSKFISIISGMSVRTKSSAYRGPSKRKSPMAALLRKEIKQYIGTPAYFINTIVGPLLLIGGSVYLFFQRSMLPEIELGLRMLGIPTGLILIAAIVSTVSINNTTAPSISLEGSRLWILKTLPVSTMNILQAKLLLHLLLVTPAILIAGIVGNLLFDLPIMERIMIFVIPFLATLVSGIIGLIANIHFPKLDAPSDTAAVKNSASVIIGSLGVMFGTILLMLLFVWMRKYLGNNILYLAFGLYLALSVLLYQYLRTKGVAKFKQII